MALEVGEQRAVRLTARLGPEWLHPFASGCFASDGTLLPRVWHPLPDFRLSVIEEGLDLLQGRLPQRLGSGTFDAIAGPFSDPKAASQGWILSFDFLRDLSPSYGDLLPILESWLRHWFHRRAGDAPTGLSLWRGTASGAGRSDGVGWRARRPLDWLRHLLPMMAGFSTHLQGKIGDQLLQDFVRLVEPERRLLASLASAFEPLSRRACWTRAVGILAVENASPGLLRPGLSQEALAEMNDLIAADGMFADGSPVGTLSAAADLAMLDRLEAINPINQRLRQAVATLRRSDGALVTFNKQRGYGGLAESVLGPTNLRRSAILKTGHIGMMEKGALRVWLRAPSGSADTGPICEVEAHGVELITSGPEAISALTFSGAQMMTEPQIRRRDETSRSQLEAKVSFEIDGQRHSCIRTLTLSEDGQRLSGEDALFAGSAGAKLGSPVLMFDLGLGCQATPSRDGESFLIRTPSGHAWRFRCISHPGAFRIEDAYSGQALTQIRRLRMICAPLGNSLKKDLVLAWDLQLEELM